jgi:hypothetical protein
MLIFRRFLIFWRKKEERSNFVADKELRTYCNMNDNKEITLTQSDNKGEIILYQPDNSLKLEVWLENETVWLNRQQISLLFDRDVKTVGKHINNALRKELSEFPTVANFATVQFEGNREVVRNIEYYNLDMILSVGYRVKSARGIQFRMWANRVLKDFLLKGYAINQQIERLEHRMSTTETKIDFFVKTSLPPVEGIFFDGQIFDAYTFVSDLIKSARKSVTLIDNYVDESVLLLLSKRAKTWMQRFILHRYRHSFNLICRNTMRSILLLMSGYSLVRTTVLSSSTVMYIISAHH